MPTRTPLRPMYLSFSDAGVPRDGRVLVDRWWVVHPERGLCFVGRSWPESAPQCNTDRRLVEQLQSALYPDHEIQFVPVAFIGLGTV